MRYPEHAYDAIQWQPGQPGHYESNYLKANAPDGQRAFWIKYNILAPFDPADPPEAELWAVLFDQETNPPLVVKEVRPMAAVKVSNERLLIESDGCRLTTTAATGQITGEGDQAAWTLKLKGNEPPLFHLPYARLYTLGFPKKKILTPAPRLTFSGELTVAGQTVAVDHWPGLRGHNWGSEHAHAYAYGNCNQFDEDPTAILDGFTARIRLGGLTSPWLSMAVLRADGQELRLNPLAGWLTPQATVTFPRWQVTFRGSGHRLRATWEAPPETFAGLCYRHPAGKVSYCANSKFATVRLELVQPNGETTVLNGRGAELEFLFPEPVEGIVWHS